MQSESASGRSKNAAVQRFSGTDVPTSSSFTSSAMLAIERTVAFEFDLLTVSFEIVNAKCYSKKNSKKENMGQGLGLRTHMRWG